MYEAQIHGNHVLIDELQASYVFKKDNGSIMPTNCNMNDPQFMENNIIIEMNVAQVREEKLNPGRNDQTETTYEW